MSFKHCKNGHLFESRLHGNICPYCHMVVEKEEDNLGSGVLNELEARLLYEEIDPVCGWLACFEGPQQGQSYVLHEGKNFIGRSDDMDIRILGDDRISRRNHAAIAYDNKTRQFMLLPGDSDGITYLGSAAVYTPTLLTDMCVIQVGRTKLIFRPLCGEHFVWSDEQEDEPVSSMRLAANLP